MRKVDFTKKKIQLKVISKPKPDHKEDLFYLMDEADRMLRLRRARERLPLYLKKEEDILWVNFHEL